VQHINHKFFLDIVYIATFLPGRRKNSHQIQKKTMRSKWSQPPICYAKECIIRSIAVR